MYRCAFCQKLRDDVRCQFFNAGTLPLQNERAVQIRRQTGKKHLRRRNVFTTRDRRTSMLNSRSIKKGYFSKSPRLVRERHTSEGNEWAFVRDAGRTTKFAAPRENGVKRVLNSGYEVLIFFPLGSTHVYLIVVLNYTFSSWTNNTHLYLSSGTGDHTIGDVTPTNPREKLLHAPWRTFFFSYKGWSTLKANAEKPTKTTRQASASKQGCQGNHSRSIAVSTILAL